MYQVRKPAAFVAAMSVCCILFGGCGGGGGGTKPPVDQPTMITGKVVDETGQAVSRALATCEGLIAETDSAGKFTINPIGQGIKTLTISKDGYSALQLPVDLNQTKVDIQGPMRLLIPTKETLEEVAAPANWPVYFTKKFGSKELLPNFLRFTPEGGVELKLYVAGAGDLPENNGRPYAWAHLEGRYTVDLFFYDVVYGGGTTNLVLTGTVVFVIPTDNIKPTVELGTIPDKVKGTINIKGTAKDLDEQGRTKGAPYVIDVDNPTKSKGLTRDYAGYHIEGPPSGIKSVTLNYNGQDHPITPDNAGSFSVAVNTKTLPDGAITFKVSAIDKANNASAVQSLTTTIDNVPDPTTDPFVTMDTIDKQLVMVNEVDEPARYIGDYWKYDGTIKFENISVDEKNQILVYAGSVIAYPRDGDPYVWAPHAWNNGRSTYSPQGYWYATGLSDEFWRFDPRTNKLDHVTLDRPGTSWMCKADNTGAFWVYWGNGHFTCLSADLKTVLKDLDTDATDVQGFAADWGKDTLVYARLSPDHTATEIVRRRISTVEVQVLESYPNIGIGGIEFDPTHGQVLVNGALDKGYLIQLGKKDGQWGELYRTPLSIPADQLVRGATFGKYYTSHSDWKVRGWQYRPL